MTDVVASIFNMANDWGFFLPKFDIHYVEKGTGIEWFINCGGTRAYFVRVGVELGSNFESGKGSNLRLALVTCQNC